MRSPAFDLPWLLRRALREHGPCVAVDDGRVRRTLAEVMERGERFANALDALGVPAGASVGILMENRAEYVDVDVGLALSRRVRVALNARLGLDHFRYAARDAGMQVLIHSAQFAGVANQLAAETGLMTFSVDPPVGDEAALSALVRPIDPTPVVRPGGAEDPAWISYTSGTTGQPKGVVLSHRSIREVAFNLMLELGRPERGSLIVLPQPVSHGAGYFVLPALLSGAGLRVMDRFDAEELLAIGRSPEARLLKIVPAMLPALLDACQDGFPYETLVYGAAPISPTLLDVALDRFGPVLVQIYGQSEAPATLTCLQKADHRGDGEQRFSAGRPWATVGLEIRDPDGRQLGAGDLGEVVVSGPHLMLRYHGLEAETREVFDGTWLRTRDHGIVDERGFVYLKGRRDEMINSGGFNVSPREVERVLLEHPSVREVVVIGVPDERWGEAITALVALRNANGTTDEELIAYSRPLLGFRAPKRVCLVDSIPMTAYGKVDRAQVANLLAQDGGRAA